MPPPGFLFVPKGCKSSRSLGTHSKAELLQNTLMGLSLPPYCCLCRDGIRLGRAEGQTLSAGEGEDKLMPFSFQTWSQTLTSRPSISSCWPRALLMRR